VCSEGGPLRPASSLRPGGELLMSKAYANSPIVEAVCEFRFQEDPRWDLTIPGLAYEKLKDEFPDREQRLLQQTKVTSGPQGKVEQELLVEERVVFLSRDKNSFVQLGRGVLSIHCLKPYPRWSGFAPKIERSLGILTGILGDPHIGRIGLRYVNRIEFPDSPVDLDAYFEFKPLLGKRLPQTMSSFVIACVFPFSAGRDSCRLHLATGVAEDKREGPVLLDIDFFVNDPGAVPIEDAMQWVGYAHEEVELLFEGCITDRLRLVFGEVA